MTSSIVRTNPTAGTATTASVRDNFGFAADEITALQRANVDIVSTTGGPVAYSASYAGSPTFSYSDGVRVIARINTTNTTTAPTLTISPVATAVPIKKADGSDVSIGDLVSGGTYEFVYNASSAEFDCLNLPGNTVTITGDQTITGSKTFTDGLTVSSSSPSPSISIQDTDASGAFVISQYNSGDGVFTVDSAEIFRVKSTGIDVTGTVLVSGDGTSGNDPDLFLRNTETAADGNITGQLLFQGKQETSSDYASYSYIVTKAVDVTDATKEGEMNFHVRDGASASPVERLSVTKDGIDVTGTVDCDGLKMDDGEYAQFGTGNDLQIFHNGTDSYIRDRGTGNLNIQTDGDRISIYDNANTRTMAQFNTDGAANLYWAGSSGQGLKLATTSTGIDVTGTVTADGVTLGNNERITLGSESGGQLEIYEATGGNGVIEQTNGGDLWVQGENITLRNDDAETLISTGHTQAFMYWQGDTGTKGERFRTTETGIDVTGDVAATTVTVGDSTGTNLELYEDSSQNAIIRQRGTGSLQITGINGSLSNDDYEALLSWGSDAINLSWQGSSGAGTKLSTTSAGIDVTGDIEVTDNTKGVILKSPNGSRFRLEVANDGTLSTEAL